MRSSAPRSVIGQATKLCAAVSAASGGNPFYVSELLRALGPRSGRRPSSIRPQLLAGGARRLPGGWSPGCVRLDPRALGLVQALAVLGDGCELRHAAAIAGVEMEEATRLAAGLVRLEVLAGEDPPRFIHPIVREGLEASLGARALRASSLRGRSLARRRGSTGAGGRASCRSGPGRRRLGVEAFAGGRAGSDGERCAANGGHLFERALCEPPPPAQRVDVLRAAARAEASAGRETACARLEEALRLADEPRERAEIALEVAEAYAALFRWVDAVDVIERALAELGKADDGLAARLEGELVICGLHDARRAARVAPVLERLSSRSPTGTAAEALAVARGMAMVLAGRPAAEAAVPLGGRFLPR